MYDGMGGPDEKSILYVIKHKTHGFQTVIPDALATAASENLDANYPTGHRPPGWEVLEVEHHSLHASMLHMTG